MASFSIPPKERAARRIGSVLAGKYEIERVIGTGGMATKLHAGDVAQKPYVYQTAPSL